MRQSILTFTLFLALLLLLPPRAAFAQTAAAEQLVVVLSAAWDAPQATLYALERNGDKWRRALGPWPVVVGKKGMGWGVGQSEGAAGPRKREGDGKAPAGLFPLLQMLGYAQTAPAQTSLPYQPITAASRCIDDSASPLYNRLVEADQLPAAQVTWTSAEVMRRKDDLYKWLIVTGYNQPAPQPQQGSCIFVHIWRSPTKGTAGCTAMAEADLLQLMSWLAADKAPQLLQLPRPVMESSPDYAWLQPLVKP